MPGIESFSAAERDWIGHAYSTDEPARRRRQSRLRSDLTELEQFLFMVSPFPQDTIHRVRTPETPIDMAGSCAEDAYAAFARGDTLVFRKAHLRLPFIASLASQLGDVLGVEVRANLYLTPPNSQGFRAHFDDHDVLALQLLGRKVWSIFRRIEYPPLSSALLSMPQKLLRDVVLPLDPQQFSTTEKESVELTEGDLLYVPRGIPHEAKTDDHVALHCTFALLHRTRAEASALMAFAASSEVPSMLKRWDHTALEGAPQEIRPAHVEQVGYTFEIVSQLSRTPLPGCYLQTLATVDSIDAATKLERRSGIRPWIGVVDGLKQFIFGTERFRVPAELDATFEFLAATTSFVVAEVPVGRAGFDEVQFCRDLVGRGLLQLAS